MSGSLNYLQSLVIINHRHYLKLFLFPIIPLLFLLCIISCGCSSSCCHFRTEALLWSEISMLWSKLNQHLGLFTNPGIALLQPGITFHALSWQLASWCGARTLSPVPHCRASVPLWGGLVTSWAVALWLTVSELLWEQWHVWVLGNESIGTASICIASRNVSSTKESI